MAKPKPQVAEQTETSATGFKPLYLALILVGLALVAVTVWYFSARGDTPVTGDIEGLQTFTDVPRGHEEGPLVYDRYPPAGGVHSPHWWNAGIYDEQFPVKKAVHTLEHGAVWISYHPDIPMEEVESLRGLVRGRTCTLLAPAVYGAQKSKVAAVAWGYALETDDVTDPRLNQFIARFERGPEAPEPGAACSNDEGRPIE